jgi:integrase
VAEGKADFHSNSILDKASQENGKLDNPSPLAQPLKCPQCASDRLYKDGLRYMADGSSVQRWLCRDCAHRFSEKPLQENLDWQINTPTLIVSKRQVCDLIEESKNLTEVARQEQAQREGTLKNADIKGKIINYAWSMQKEGYSEATILGRSKLLKILAKRGADLYDPESVKTAIAKQPWCEGRKANAVDAYTSFLKTTGGKWEPPRYQSIRKIPFIPTETEIDQLISACSKRMSTFLQLLKETGMRCGESWRTEWNDIDNETKTVRISPEKHSNPRIIHISPKLAAMLEALPKTYGTRIFSLPQSRLDQHRNIFIQQRKRIANKLQNPRLLRITFHTFRHFKGTMEYHRTKDILHVMQVLGHKNIKNTLLYVQLAEELFRDQQEYISKIAKTETDACALIDAGFEYVCDFDNAKIFRKKKY